MPATLSCLLAITVFAAPLSESKPTLFIVGDSTVHNGTRGQQGWGDPIIQLFDPSRIHVENHAMGGRSSRTFQTEGRWNAILHKAKPGDFVLIQMGHNDASKINDDSRARGSLPGVGEESQEIDNLLTKKHETVHSYGWYLRKYIADAKAKGMTPIICSPIPHTPRRKVARGEVENNRYAAWAEQVARSQNVPFIHLNKLVMSHYVGMTPDEIKAKYFTPADNTHTSPAGAELNAECVVDGIKGLKDCPLASYLRKKEPELPISVTEDKNLGSLHLWHLYERTDATAAVGDEITVVGRIPAGESQILLEAPPWLTVAFSKEKKHGADRPGTFQAFSLQCEKRPKDLDTTGFATMTGRVLVNRPELSADVKYQQIIPVFRMEVSKVTPLHCRRSLDELQKAAAADIRSADGRIRKLCASHGLQYEFDDSKLSHSWYQGLIAFTSIVSKHPVFSFRPVPYATISVLYKLETGELTGFVFTRRVWQDPHD